MRKKRRWQFSIKLAVYSLVLFSVVSCIFAQRYLRGVALKRLRDLEVSIHWTSLGESRGLGFGEIETIELPGDSNASDEITRLLSRVGTFNSIEIPANWDLGILGEFSNVKRVVIENRTQFDFSAVPLPTGVRNLSIRCEAISNEHLMSKYTNLETLHIACSEPITISAVKDFQSLTGVQLAEGSVSDLSVLATLPVLEDIVIRKLKTPTDLTPIEELSRLKQLRIIDCNLRSLSLNKLTHLEHLSISDSRVPIDLTSLNCHQTLRSLSVRRPISLAPLRNMCNLGSLIITESALREEDVEVIVGISSLQSLTLSHVDIDTDLLDRLKVSIGSVSHTVPAGVQQTGTSAVLKIVK